MRHALLITAAAIAVGACQPQAPDGSVAQPPADAPPVAPELPAAFQGDLDAHGTEPFWGIKIREAQIEFSTPEANIAFPNKGGGVADGKAVWESAAGGKPIKVTLSEQAGCSDGMSDLTYPLAAEVVLGDATYKGCAVKAAEKPTEGR